MSCKTCEHYNDNANLCEADMFDTHPVSCLLKMILQELRIQNLPEEGDDWKFDGTI